MAKPKNCFAQVIARGITVRQTKAPLSAATENRAGDGDDVRFLEESGGEGCRVGAAADASEREQTPA